jgi:hypothetical protein
LRATTSSNGQVPLNLENQPVVIPSFTTYLIPTHLVYDALPVGLVLGANDFEIDVHLLNHFNRRYWSVLQYVRRCDETLGRKFPDLCEFKT